MSIQGEIEHIPSPRISSAYAGLCRRVEQPGDRRQYPADHRRIASTAGRYHWQTFAHLPVRFESRFQVPDHRCGAPTIPRPSPGLGIVVPSLEGTRAPSPTGHSAVDCVTYSHEFEKAARSDERRERIENMYGAPRQGRELIAVAR